MSLTKSALLGGSSLLAAGLIAILSPTTAAAQANCTATTTVNNNNTNAVTIAGGANDPGITCAYTGTVATVTTLGAVTVSSSAGGNGINLTGGASDAIRWTSTAAPSSFSAAVAGGANTNGPVIDAQTGGAIVLNVGNVSVSGTDGIYARSTNGGAVTLTTGSVGTGTAVAGNAAIEAISNGGNITVTTNGDVGTIGGSTTANTRNRDGIVATTSGAGVVDLTINNPNFGNTVYGFGAGGAAVRVTNGTGAVNIDASGDIRGGTSQGSGQAQLGSALVIDSDGHIVIESSRLIMGAINETGAQPAAIVASGQTFTLTLTGDAASTPDAIQGYRASLGGYYDSEGQVGQSTGQISNASQTNRRTGGHVDLSGVTGGATLNFNTRARWMLTETSVMSGGADVVNVDATSVIVTAMQGSYPPLVDDVDQEVIRPGIVDFGAGADAVNSSGRVVIGPVYSSDGFVGEASDLPAAAAKRFGIRGEARLLNLEAFNNTGEIWLGARLHSGSSVSGTPSGLLITDQFHDDMLYMPGATFDGGEGSIVYMDVNLEETQASCAPSTRDEQGYLPAADCIGLQGGAATGVTELRIFEFVPGDRGSYNPDGTVLVDLAGGDPEDTEVGAFVISPDTPRYADIGNGAIDKGVFAFVLGFDADDQQFKLYGIPGSGGQQLPMLATAANQLWQTATGGWFQRQVDQRDVERDDGLGTGAWVNITGSNATRDILTAVPIGTGTADFDNTYEQKDVAITFGWDLIDQDSQALSWSLGAMVGYAQSEVDFDDSGNSANLEGVHGGVYGGLTFSQFFVDAAVNATRLSLHNDVPALGLIPAGTLLDTTVQSLGVRIEAGWRWDAGVAWVEPIVGFSTVKTEFDDFRIPNDDPDLNRPGVSVALQNAESRRASLGLRVGADDLISDVAPTSLSLTARRVNEFEGGSDIVIANTGPDALVNDTFDGAFTQLTGSVGVSNAARTVSGYLNVDAVAGDDFESLGVSAGLRLQW